MIGIFFRLKVVFNFKSSSEKRKYFEVDGVKFKMENKEQETGGYTADWKLYFSKQEILDEQEFQKLERDIRSKFNAFGKLDLTLDQLKRINEIINE